MDAADRLVVIAHLAGEENFLSFYNMCWATLYYDHNFYLDNTVEKS